MPYTEKEGLIEETVETPLYSKRMKEYLLRVSPKERDLIRKNSKKLLLFKRQCLNFLHGILKRNEEGVNPGNNHSHNLRIINKIWMSLEKDLAYSEFERPFLLIKKIIVDIISQALEDGCLEGEKIAEEMKTNIIAGEPLDFTSPTWLKSEEENPEKGVKYCDVEKYFGRGLKKIRSAITELKQSIYQLEEGGGENGQKQLEYKSLGYNGEITNFTSPLNEIDDVEKELTELVENLNVWLLFYEIRTVRIALQGLISDIYNKTLQEFMIFGSKPQKPDDDFEFSLKKTEYTVEKLISSILFKNMDILRIERSLLHPVINDLTQKVMEGLLTQFLSDSIEGRLDIVFQDNDNFQVNRTGNLIGEIQNDFITGEKAVGENEENGKSFDEIFQFKYARPHRIIELITYYAEELKIEWLDARKIDLIKRVFQKESEKSVDRDAAEYNYSFDGCFEMELNNDIEKLNKFITVWERDDPKKIKSNIVLYINDNWNKKYKNYPKTKKDLRPSDISLIKNKKSYCTHIFNKLKLKSLNWDARRLYDLCRKAE